MARSEEAMQRRALKRQKTDEEQRLADGQDMAKRMKQDMEKGMKRRGDDYDRNVPSMNNNNNNKIVADADALKEAGAWKCPKCANENFASRNYCNSKTCDEVRPYDSNAHQRQQQQRKPPPRRRDVEQQRMIDTKNAMDEPGAWRCESCSNQNFASREVCYSKTCQQTRPTNVTQKKKSARHDEDTSKTLVWPKLAAPETLSKNQDLRKKYQETGGTGMEPEEVERAKILIARDERKRQKKEQQKKPDKNKAEASEKTTVEDSQKNETMKEASSSPKMTKNNNTEEVSKTTVEEDSQNDSKTTKEASSSSKMPKSTLKSSRDKNRSLRERYLDTFGKGMKPEEIERAKTLIARDERKRKQNVLLLEGKKKEAGIV